MELLRDFAAKLAKVGEERAESVSWEPRRTEAALARSKMLP